MSREKQEMLSQAVLGLANDDTLRYTPYWNGSCSLSSTWRALASQFVHVPFNVLSGSLLTHVHVYNPSRI